VNNSLFGTAQTSSMIYLDCEYKRHQIANNYFHNIVGGPAILSTKENHILVSGNQFDIAADVSAIKGKLSFTNISGNSFMGYSNANGTGIEVTSNVSNQTITSNIFLTMKSGILAARNATINGNAFNDVDSVIISGYTSSIIGNDFSGCAGTLSPTDSVIEGNRFESHTGAIAPTTSILRNNSGYLTNAAGTANFTAATSLVITHGLAATPTKVIVTGSDANSNALWVTSIGATTFTINRGNSTGTPAVYWYAEV